MKRIVIIILSVMFFLCSCGKKEELLHYQAYPFEGEFEIEKNDFIYTLRMRGDLWDGNNERDFAAEILTPEELEGIKILRENGKVKISLGGVEFEENEASPFLLHDFAEYFELMASPEGFSREGDKTVAQLKAENGEDIRIVFSSDGLPTEIDGERMNIKVVMYKVKDDG